MKENRELEKKLNRLAVGVSIIVLVIVGLMRRIKIDVGVDFSFLPPFHAFMNLLACFALIAALIFIKKGNMDLHKKSIYFAMLCSAIFLVSYVVYHFTTPETKYCHDGSVRSVYFFFLITHVILAGAILPFILFTFNRAFTGDYERHKNMARWVFPLWLYVTATGPICYWMLKDCY